MTIKASLEEFETNDRKRAFLYRLYAKGLIVAIILSDQENTGTLVNHKPVFYSFPIYSDEYLDTKTCFMFKLLPGYKRKILDGYQWRKM